MTNILFFSVFTVHTSHNSSAKKSLARATPLQRLGRSVWRSKHRILVLQTADFGWFIRQKIEKSTKNTETFVYIK